MLAGNEWQSHMIQGWTPDFIPAVLNAEVADPEQTLSEGNVNIRGDIFSRATATSLGDEGFEAAAALLDEGDVDTARFRQGQKLTGPLGAYLGGIPLPKIFARRSWHSNILV